MTGAGIGPVGEPVVGLPVAGPQQVRDGVVGAALDEVADPVAAVQEATALAVDVARAMSRRR